MSGSLVVPLALTATPSAVAATAPCAAPADTVAPTISSLTLSKASVNVSSNSATIKVTADASDTSGSGVATGVDAILVTLTGPGRSQRHGAVTELFRTSGDDLSGTWTGQLELPRYSPAGTYNISEVDAFDAAGNLASYSESAQNSEGEGFGYLIAVSGGSGLVPLLHRVEAAKAEAASGYSTHTTSSHSMPATTSSAPTSFSAASPNDPRLQTGWTTTVQVVSTGGPPNPPAHAHYPNTGKLTGFHVTPTIVNTRQHASSIHATATFAGHQPRFVEAYFADGHNRNRSQFGLRLRHHGRHWSGSTKLRQWFRNQTEHISLFAEYVAHGEHHEQAFPSDSLESRGFTHVIKILSRTDNTSPVFHSLTVTPNPVDSQSGPATFTVSAKLTDTGSGVAFAVVPVLESLSFNGFDGDFPVGFVVLHHDGGDWIGRSTVHKCDPSGTFTLALEAQDVAGNELDASPGAIAKAGSPDHLTFETDSNGEGAPEISELATGPQTIDIDFSLPVVGLSSSNLSLFDLTPASQRYRSTTPIDSMTCYNDSTEEPCDGSVDPVTSATLDVSTLSSSDTYELWANLDSVTSQLTSVNGYPIPAIQAASEQFPG